MIGLNLRKAIALALAAVVLLAAKGASAQRRRPQQAEPKPEPKAAPSEDEEDHAPVVRTEPEIPPPADPLALSPDARARIGSDWDARPPSPEGSLEATKWFPYYEERRGDYRLRLLPPFVIEQTRGLRDPSQARWDLP